MNVLVIDNQSKFLENLVCVFPANVTVIKPEKIFETDIASFDLIVLSGGSHVPTVLNHPEHYQAEMNVVRTSSLPILGICLGSEIISAAFGGVLQELPVSHSGEVTLTISNPELRSQLETTTIKVHESHRIRTVQLPQHFVACASSSHGIEIFKHETKPILGIQFHPEVASNAKLIAWVLETLHITGS
jgi:GMP synthase (glutamine-hydrolysing)